MRRMRVDMARSYRAARGLSRISLCTVMTGRHRLLHDAAGHEEQVSVVEGSIKNGTIAGRIASQITSAGVSLRPAVQLCRGRFRRASELVRKHAAPKR